MAFLVIFIVSLALPLFLLPIEKIWPYPYLIEELAKLFLAWLILRMSQTRKWLLLFLGGFLFSLSESLFYLGAAFSGGYAFLFGKKILLVFPFHLLTLTLFYLSIARSKKLLLFSFPAAVLLHFLFNQFF